MKQHFHIRIMDEDAKTFKDVWQVTQGGVQVGFVNDDGTDYELPQRYSGDFLDPTPHHAPHVVTEPLADRLERLAQEHAQAEAAAVEAAELTADMERLAALGRDVDERAQAITKE